MDSETFTFPESNYEYVLKSSCYLQIVFWDIPKDKENGKMKALLP